MRALFSRTENELLISPLAASLAPYSPDNYAQSGLPTEIIQAVLNNIKIISALSPEQQSFVIPAYINAVDHVFLVGITAGALASLSACLIRRSAAVKDVQGWEGGIGRNEGSLEHCLGIYIFA